MGNTIGMLFSAGAGGTSIAALLSPNWLTGNSTLVSGQSVYLGVVATCTGSGYTEWKCTTYFNTGNENFHKAVTYVGWPSSAWEKAFYVMCVGVAITLAASILSILATLCNWYCGCFTNFGNKISVLCGVLCTLAWILNLAAMLVLAGHLEATESACGTRAGPWHLGNCSMGWGMKCYIAAICLDFVASIFYGGSILSCCLACCISSQDVEPDPLDEKTMGANSSGVQAVGSNSIPDSAVDTNEQAKVDKQPGPVTSSTTLTV